MEDADIKKVDLVGSYARSGASPGLASGPDRPLGRRTVLKGLLASAGIPATAGLVGCGGMSDLAGRLTEAARLPVIDGVRAAVTLAEGLIRCGLTTSKYRTYAPPVPVPYLTPAAG